MKRTWMSILLPIVACVLLIGLLHLLSLSRCKDCACEPFVEKKGLKKKGEKKRNIYRPNTVKLIFVYNKKDEMHKRSLFNIRNIIENERSNITFDVLFLGFKSKILRNLNLSQIIANDKFETIFLLDKDNTIVKEYIVSSAPPAELFSTINQALELAKSQNVEVSSDNQNF